MKVQLASLLRCRILLLPLILLLVSLHGRAQQNSTITGTVEDKAGAVIPGAEVTLTQQQTGFVTKAHLARAVLEARRDAHDALTAQMRAAASGLNTQITLFCARRTSHCGAEASAPATAGQEPRHESGGIRGQ